MIQECVKEELQAFLHDKQFCSQSCQRWCLELSQNIKTSVHRMKHFESKIVWSSAIFSYYDIHHVSYMEYAVIAARF